MTKIAIVCAIGLMSFKAEAGRTIDLTPQEQAQARIIEREKQDAQLQYQSLKTDPAPQRDPQKKAGVEWALSRARYDEEAFLAKARRVHNAPGAVLSADGRSLVTPGGNTLALLRQYWWWAALAWLLVISMGAYVTGKVLEKHRREGKA